MARSRPDGATRVAIYARISLDRNGAGLGVQRQIEDCQRLASERGWEAVATYTDNDISAYSGKPRPGYKQLLADMRSGVIDTVIAWHTDRLHRSPRELEEWIEVSERHHVTTTTVRSGELDLSTAAGRMVARMLGAAARHESEQKSERVRRAREQAAAMGKHHGKLGYGYGADGTIDPSQAEIIREIADRILAGETLHAVARDLNARGVPSPGGAQWRTGNMRAMIMRGVLCGWREWEPGGHGHGSGELIAKGTWSPILDRPTTERLRALLNDPSRKRGRQPQNLLTSILVCGRCHARMSGARNGEWGRRYACIAQPGLRRCGRCTVVAEPVEELVTEAVFAVLTGSELPASDNLTSSADRAAVAELDDARGRLQELAEAYAAGRITQTEWTAARSVAVERLESAQAAFAVPRTGAVLAGLPRKRRDLERWWADATLERKRAILKILIERVVVQPAGKQRNRFDPSRIEPPMWRV